MKIHALDNLIAQLNGIYHFSAMGDAESVRAQIKALTETLRYKNRHQNEYVSLQTEMSIVKNFVFLFLPRWGDFLRVTIDLPESMESENIPHYAVMTFVENALFHAFERQENIRILKISVEKDKRGITILVDDNGCGFTLGAVESAPYDDFCPDYGTVISLRERLQLLYRGEASLCIASAPEEKEQAGGTHVKLFLPPAKI